MAAFVEDAGDRYHYQGPGLVPDVPIDIVLADNAWGYLASTADGATATAFKVLSPSASVEERAEFVREQSDASLAPFQTRAGVALLFGVEYEPVMVAGCVDLTASTQGMTGVEWVQSCDVGGEVGTAMGLSGDRVLSSRNLDYRDNPRKLLCDAAAAAAAVPAIYSGDCPESDTETFERDQSEAGETAAEYGETAPQIGETRAEIIERYGYPLEETDEGACVWAGVDGVRFEVTFGDDGETGCFADEDSRATDVRAGGESEEPGVWRPKLQGASRPCGTVERPGPTGAGATASYEVHGISCATGERLVKEFYGSGEAWNGDFVCLEAEALFCKGSDGWVRILP